MNDREAWSRRREAGATGGVNAESCVRSHDPSRPPIGAGGGAAPAWCARSLTRVSRWSPSSFSGYVRRRGCRLTPTLDSPTHQTTPLRVPRSSGFRRWARSAQRCISQPSPDSSGLSPDLPSPGPSRPVPPSAPFPQCEPRPQSPLPHPDSPGGGPGSRGAVLPHRGSAPPRRPPHQPSPRVPPQDRPRSLPELPCALPVTGEYVSPTAPSASQHLPTLLPPPRCSEASVLA